MSNPFERHQGDGGRSPDNTPSGTRPANFRPAMPILPSSASTNCTESFGYTPVRPAPALPTNSGNSAPGLATSNDEGSLLGVPAHPSGNSCSQSYVEAPAAHKVHTYSTAAPAFDIFSEAPYQPDLLSGVTEGIPAMDIFLPETETSKHVSTGWWPPHSPNHTPFTLQDPHRALSPSPTNLSRSPRSAYRSQCAYPSTYNRHGLFPTIPSKASSGDLAYSPKRNDFGERLISQCALDEFKHKSMEEHRWDAYDADHEGKDTLQEACVLAKVPEKLNKVTLDFPLWNLSPPPFTLIPVVQANHIEASGSLTPVRGVLEGRQLPLSQSIWDTTSNEVHDILSVADPTGRELLLPTLTADQLDSLLRMPPSNGHDLKEAIAGPVPAPAALRLGQTEQSNRGASLVSAGAGDQQTGSVGSNLENSTCVPSMLNTSRASVLFSPPHFYFPGPADANSTRIHQLPASKAVVGVVPEVPLPLPCSSVAPPRPLKELEPEAGVNCVTRQELKGLHPMVASLGYLSHVLQAFQLSPSSNSEMEANCKVLETTISNLANCLCAQQDKVLQSFLAADASPPRKSDNVTSVKIVDQNQSGRRMTHAAEGKVTAESSTSGGVREIENGSKICLNEQSAERLIIESGPREAQLVSKVLQIELNSKDAELSTLRSQVDEMKAQVTDLQSREEQLMATLEDLTEELQLEREESKGTAFLYTNMCKEAEQEAAKARAETQEIRKNLSALRKVEPRSIGNVMNEGGGEEVEGSTGDAVPLEKDGCLDYRLAILRSRHAQIAGHFSSKHESSPETLKCSSEIASDIDSALMEQTILPTQEAINGEVEMQSDFSTNGSIKHRHVGDLSPSCEKEGDTETTEANLLINVQLRAAIIQSRAMHAKDAGNCETHGEDCNSPSQFARVVASLEKCSPGSSSSLPVEAVNEVAVYECASELELGRGDNGQHSIGLHDSEFNDSGRLFLCSASKASAANICESSAVNQDPPPADDRVVISRGSEDHQNTEGDSNNDPGKPGGFFVDMAEALGWEHVKLMVPTESKG